MKRKDNNLSHCSSVSQSDENISRLVKLVGGSRQPAKTFTESLINNALDKLELLKIESEQYQKNIVMKAMGLAAMFVAACGAGLTVVVSALLKINFFVEAVIVLIAFFNWLTYLGGRIL